MFASAALLALLVSPYQEEPSVPLPNDPIAIEQGTDDPETPPSASTSTLQLEAFAEATLAPSGPAQESLGSEGGGIRPVTDEETFIRSLEEQIRKDNPELGDDAVRDMAQGIAEMRRRLSQQSPLGPVIEVPGNPGIGSAPDGRGVQIQRPGAGFSGPGMPPGMSVPSPGAPGMMPGQGMGPGSMPNNSISNIDHSNPDQFFINALRQAARQLDEAAAVLEERAAYDLADQMRDQAKRLRDEARTRAADLRHPREPGMVEPGRRGGGGPGPDGPFPGISGPGGSVPGGPGERPRFIPEGGEQPGVVPPGGGSGEEPRRRPSGERVNEGNPGR